MIVMVVMLKYILTLRTVLGCGRIRESPPGSLPCPTSQVLKIAPKKHHQCQSKKHDFNPPMVNYWPSVNWRKNVLGRLTQYWSRVLLSEEKGRF